MVHEFLDTDSTLLYQYLTADDLIIIFESTHIFSNVAHLLELTVVLLVRFEQFVCFDRQVVLRYIILGKMNAREWCLPRLINIQHFFLETIRDEGCIHQHTVLPLVVDGQQHMVVHVVALFDVLTVIVEGEATTESVANEEGMLDLALFVCGHVIVQKTLQCVLNEYFVFLFL